MKASSLGRSKSLFKNLNVINHAHKAEPEVQKNRLLLLQQQKRIQEQKIKEKKSALSKFFSKQSIKSGTLIHIISDLVKDKLKEQDKNMKPKKFIRFDNQLRGFELLEYYYPDITKEEYIKKSKEEEKNPIVKLKGFSSFKDLIDDDQISEGFMGEDGIEDKKEKSEQNNVLQMLQAQVSNSKSKRRRGGVIVEEIQEGKEAHNNNTHNVATNDLNNTKKNINHLQYKLSQINNLKTNIQSKQSKHLINNQIQKMDETYYPKLNYYIQEQLDKTSFYFMNSRDQEITEEDKIIKKKRLLHQQSAVDFRNPAINPLQHRNTQLQKTMNKQYIYNWVPSTHKYIKKPIFHIRGRINTEFQPFYKHIKHNYAKQQIGKYRSLSNHSKSYNQFSLQAQIQRATTEI